MSFNKPNHHKIVSLFRDNTNNLEYTTNGNTENQCTSDCQKFMHISTDIGSKISGVITCNDASKALYVGCHHDVVDNKIITYGELQVTARGLNAGLVWHCLYDYLWKECFQIPVNVYNGYDQRNVQAFSILLRSNNYINKDFIAKDMMLFNDLWKFKRNTRFVYLYCTFD